MKKGNSVSDGTEKCDGHTQTRTRTWIHTHKHTRTERDRERRPVCSDNGTNSNDSIFKLMTPVSPQCIFQYKF